MPPTTLDLARIAAGLIAAALLGWMIVVGSGGAVYDFHTEEYSSGKPFTMRCDSLFQKITWGGESHPVILVHTYDETYEITDGRVPVGTDFAEDPEDSAATDAAIRDRLDGLCEDSRSGATTGLALLAVPTAAAASLALRPRKREP